MNFFAQKTCIFIAIILFVGFAGIFLSLHHRRHAELNNFTIPDSFAENLTVKHFNDDGQIISQITASHMQMDGKTQQMVFSNPSAYFFSLHQPPWWVKAEKAISHVDFKKVDLYHQVVMRQTNPKNNMQTEIQTSTVTINTETQQAVTNAPVQLIQSSAGKIQTKINTIGVAIDQKTGLIKLLSKADGYYVPPQK